eukprot:gb/GEZJ01007155.1/.p2 GENE.gb/GEZJ01007155.1/~~gb/GEZJ01007155.1/.p2  ORF type:complete len:121 (-),score=10.72 gb/GEZJ01007155.1/:48-410(-)
MLRKALINYLTVSTLVEARLWMGNRNRREAATLARVIECFISSLGVMSAKNKFAVELPIRGLAAETIIDKTGNWEAVRELEEELHHLKNKLRKSKFHNSTKLRKKVRNNFAGIISLWRSL